MSNKFKNYFILILISFTLTSCDSNGQNIKKIIGHRGLASLAPENTLSGIDSAICYGIQIIEVDIRRTKDSVLILMHDKTVNRTTNGRGVVKDLSWNYISALNIEKFNIYEKVPSLDTVLNYLKNKKIELILELKNPEDYPGIEKQIIQMIKSYDMQSKVTIASFNQTSLKSINKIDSTISIGIFSIFPNIPKFNFQNIEFIGVHWSTVYIMPNRMKKIKNEMDVAIFVWTVNEQKRAKRLINKEIDGIISDIYFEQ